jgi:hypothetical protein
MVWSMLLWNEPRLSAAANDRLSVITTDNHYQSEEECRRNARSVVERVPKARIACVQTLLAKAELEQMKQYEQLIEKSPDGLNPPKP